MKVSVTKQDTGSAAAVVMLDGNVVATTALTLWTGFSGSKPYITLRAGYVPGPTQPWSIRIDSVTMDNI